MAELRSSELQLTRARVIDMVSCPTCGARWLLSRLDVAILKAVIALDHEWAPRAEEVLAENEQWRQRLWPENQ